MNNYQDDEVFIDDQSDFARKNKRGEKKYDSVNVKELEEKDHRYTRANDETPIIKRKTRDEREKNNYKRQHEVDLTSERASSHRSNREGRSKSLVKPEKSARQRKEEDLYYSNANFGPRKSEQAIRREIDDRDFSQGRKPRLGASADRMSRSMNIDKGELTRKYKNDLAQKKQDERVQDSAQYVISSKNDFDDQKLKRNLTKMGYHVYDMRTSHNPIANQGVKVSLKVHNSGAAGGKCLVDLENQIKSYNLNYEKMPAMEFPDAHKSVLF